MTYKKGQPVTICVKGDTRTAVIEEDGIDNKGKVRFKPAGFPFAISILETEIVG